MQKKKYSIPSAFKQQHSVPPVWFVTTEEGKHSRIADYSEKSINDALYSALSEAVEFRKNTGQALLKVHIGEPATSTRLRPEYTVSSVQLLHEMGAEGVAAGDTTVAYTGKRGHRQNPPGNCIQYLELAKKHGWNISGAAGIPFVVLDRPDTSLDGIFSFSREYNPVQISGINRYREFYLAGGFNAAGCVVNHAHLTLHDLAGVAGCIKSIAMGCSALKGKYMMHQSMLPVFDGESCVQCGLCVESCPENALSLTEEQKHPSVDAQFCIGCGECTAVCPSGAVEIHGREISDWVRGKDTLPSRMTDYVVGLMNGKWNSTVHVLHMYTVTEKCDCVDIKQEPLISRDLGFLIGKNPFAVDLIASRLLAREIAAESVDVDESVLRTAAVSAEYAYENYEIIPEAQVHKLFI